MDLIMFGLHKEIHKYKPILVREKRAVDPVRSSDATSGPVYTRPGWGWGERVKRHIGPGFGRTETI